jgi:hypothetical protein
LLLNSRRDKGITMYLKSSRLSAFIEIPAKS